jgi:hypothetical protein
MATTTRDVRRLAAELAERDPRLDLFTAVSRAVDQLDASRDMFHEACQEMQREVGTDNLAAWSAGQQRSAVRLALLYPPVPKAASTALRYQDAARLLDRAAGELGEVIATLRRRLGDAPGPQRTRQACALRTLEAALAALGRAEGECLRVADEATSAPREDA